MEKSTFEKQMRYAQTMREVETDRGDYWAGYQRGLRRRYHGENFGTEEEHQLWSTASGDESREQRKNGYNDGYHFKHEETNDRISVRIPGGLLALIDQRAEKENRTRSNMIITLLQKSIDPANLNYGGKHVE